MGESVNNFSQYSPLALAYLGDAVYELIIREMLVKEGNRQVQKLHKDATHYVSASAQASIVDRLMERLTEEEVAIFKRGRNANAHAAPKNQDVIAYRKSTGFEAVIGWLYLCGRKDRIMELLGPEINKESE